MINRIVMVDQAFECSSDEKRMVMCRMRKRRIKTLRVLKRKLEDYRATKLQEGWQRKPELHYSF